MEIKKYTWIALLGMILFTLPFSAQSQRKKKNKENSAYMQADSRSAAVAASRKTPDPFGFLKGSNDQHKKNKDCGCPGTKKGERQRRKEFKAHRKRK